MKLRKSIVFTLFITLLLGLTGMIAQLWTTHTDNQMTARADNPASTTTGFVVDRHAIAQFDDIPDAYIDAAADMTLLFRHASVGDNINRGLNCLADNVTPRPNNCDRDLDPDEIYYDEKYDRSNWDFEFHSPPPNPNPGWWNKVDYFIDRVNGLPSGQYDMVAYKFGYVDGDTNSNIHIHFFDPDSHMPNYTDLAALQAAHPDKIIVWWTMGLARAIGTEPATILNNDMRAYAAANDIILMDIADIVSHTPDGQPCFHNGYPAMCANYTNESQGGHLNSRGMLYMAKAYWVLMARLAGWEPGTGITPTPTTTGTPPTATPSPTPSLTPSSTPSPDPSLTPSVTPSPTPSLTPSITPSPDPSVTPSATPSATLTPDPSVTPSATPSATPTATPNPNLTERNYLPLIVKP